MIASDDIAEILRLDDLETKAWSYFAKGKARGSAHTEIRALRLLHAAHVRGNASLGNNIASHNVIWWR